MLEPFGNFREGESILLVNFALQGFKKHALSGIYLACYVDERGSHPIKT